MITKIETFKENFNFNIEKSKPTTKVELINLIRETIKRYGHKCDLNFIDTSLIENMANLFSYYDTRKFNGDISGWDVSNVTTMDMMFMKSNFNGDISKWDVSNVTNMKRMFRDSKLETQNKLPSWYKQ